MNRHSLLAGIAGLLALLPLSSLAAMQAKPVEWGSGGERYAGVLVYDDANAIKRPGLVMVPNWMGVTTDAIQMAKRVAGHDYVVLVADVYGKNVRPKDDAQALAAVKQVYADGGKTLRARTRSAVDALNAHAKDTPLQPGRIGAFGFCFGGGAVIELARSGIDLPGGIVSFHGNLDSHRPADGAIRSSLLVLNGADDSSVPPEQIAGFEKEMKAAKADWQLVNFGGARHCFSQPEDAGNPADSNCLYNERAAHRAFGMMQDFLRERFGSKAQ